MKTGQGSVISSPPTTPGSLEDHEPFLAGRGTKKAGVKWYRKYRPPIALILISIVQITIYCSTNTNTNQNKTFYFDPLEQEYVWRFITYMFIHGSVVHITLNVILQCIIAYRLEESQGSIRVSALYFLGGATGALCASCLRADLISGASAGVYALLTSHISHVLVTDKSTREKIVTFVSVILLISSDTIYYFFHARYLTNQIISEGAHIGGAIGGLFLGLIIYGRQGSEPIKVPQDCVNEGRIVHWVALVAYVFVILAFIGINFKIKKCTPLNDIRDNYVYFC